MSNKSVYNSRHWQRLRAYKLRLDPLCEYCPADHRRPATEVDHVVAISAGGDPYDIDNLKSACHSCHSRKTARHERIIGCDIHGNPVDPRHYWNEKSLRADGADRASGFSTE